MCDELTQHSFAYLMLKTASELLIAALVSKPSGIPGSRSQFAAPISMEPVRRDYALCTRNESRFIFHEASFGSTFIGQLEIKGFPSRANYGVV
ncbi:hypothetical protein CEXT_458421 [Caerostris extrusa]|uniref:Uncharacterized protein n=1 Tax=Caerostris extrusa TaxID=172846 RepID=A0AAV4R700_CAEEX|nr:hypothetical protein CEXT_458421 [Caerostris extrusa]